MKQITDIIGNRIFDTDVMEIMLEFTFLRESFYASGDDQRELMELIHKHLLNSELI